MERDDGQGLFEDPDFPPLESSLFSDYTTPISKFCGDIVWMRPQAICQSPKLFPENPKDGHAKQGILGDCWFLCACSMLLKNKLLMDKVDAVFQVVPFGQPQWGECGYTGRFRFSFWQFGCWIDVEIDDQLPCIGARLCFSHCQSPSAFWVALLEKAYAKLHGSYEKLWAGQVAEALVDVSGGLAERWSLKEVGKELRQQGEDDIVQKKFSLSSLLGVGDRCVMSCSVHSSPGGAGELGQFHAFSVMEWVELQSRGIRLLRIRNPWGRRCWGGIWSEGGEGWNQLEPGCTEELLGRTEEGEFWIEEGEFLKEFDEVTVAYPISEQGFLQSIHTGRELVHSNQVCGSWVKGRSAGGCRNNSSFSTNPKFWLRISESGEILLSLLQHQRWRLCALSVRGTARPDLCSLNFQREGREENMPMDSSKQHHLQAIGLHLWKVEKKRFNLAKTLNTPPCASTHCHAYDREVTLHTQLSAGFYLLIPSTFLQEAEAGFLLRVFSNAPVTLSALKAPPSPTGDLAASVQEGEWETSCSEGQWIPGATAGGSRNFPSHLSNPRVPFTVNCEPRGANVRITLQQHCPAKDCQPIGFHVYQISEEGREPQISQDQEPQASCVPHRYTQEVSLLCSLAPGHYIIVPSTYQPDCQGCFSVTVARKIDRKAVESKENLGRIIQEVSYISVMRS
ncbi:calpain-10 isoform X1 [Lepisosteus oculatus]|uniref:calpain-10 isoform X1 n=1 Tax=Lepisosteus oculatus TaxID=7918 RepID=UPI0035F50F5C